MSRVTLAALFAFTAGCPATPSTPCGQLCKELVQSCSYEAYPTYDSCLQGCEYNSEQGADVRGEEACVSEAACDTFAILECEHAYN